MSMGTATMSARGTMTSSTRCVRSASTFWSIARSCGEKSVAVALSDERVLEVVADRGRGFQAERDEQSLAESRRRWSRETIRSGAGFAAGAELVVSSVLIG